MRLLTRLLVLVASLALFAQADDDLSTKISSTINEFSGLIVEHYYLTNDMTNASPDDAEVVLLRTSKNDLYVTYNQGKTFKQVLKGEDIIAIYPNPHFKNRVYFLTPDEKVFFTIDKGESFKSFRTPAPPNQRGLQLMTFDRNNKDAFIWTGSEGCEDELSPRCKVVTHYTNNNGGRWTEVGNGAIMCQYVNGLKDQKRNNLMYCLFEYNEGGVKKSRLAYSTDNFRNQRVTHENVLDFALAEEFLVVAVINDEDETLECQTSVDGESFSVARFPPDFKVPKQLAYTVLQSTTHAIFLHVTVNGKANSEYGAILKSNSYGTSFMLSLNEVNRNRVGFVDFEKMANLEGVAVSNIVINARQASRGSRKQLKSMITHNDGGQWAYLNPPPADTEGKAYSCSGQSLEKCSLNLHGFTERKDYRDTYTSASAVGMMIGVGNVGEYLEGYLDGNTYLTVDGGITWREIKKGAYMWEYGDQGSILVIVDGEEPTNEVFFSLDEGVTWNPYRFSEDLVKVDDISTVPNDNSRRFLLTGKSPRSKGEQSTTVHIDFSGLSDRQCKLDESNPDRDDYELWSPRNPTQQSNCLFGHETQYYRKLVDSKCYIGRQLIQPHKVVQDCECTREDFECDFNYVRDRDGTCKLVKGASPPDHALQCKENPNLVEYYESTGYRRIPLSTCKGGQELDKADAIPCPGKKGEFSKKHGGGLGVIGTFFVIIVPIAMACVIGFIIFQHYQSKFGVIRLGDEDSFSSSSSNPVVQQALKGLAYVVAGITMIPEALKGVGEFARGIFGHSGSSNRPWSRDYAPVDINEDDELLGDDIESDAEEVSDSSSSPYSEERVPMLRARFSEWLNQAAWKAPSLLILDNIDRIIPAEMEHVDSQRSRQLAEAFVARVKDCVKSFGVFVVATAQSSTSIHSLLNSSHLWLDNLQLKPPGKEGRREILDFLVGKKLKNANGTLSAGGLAASDLNFVTLATQTEGYLPADLRDLVERATHQAAIRSANATHKAPSARPAVNGISKNGSQHGAANGVVITHAQAEQGLSITMDDFTQAQDGFTPLSLRDVKLEKSSVAWSDIGGLVETRRVLRETLEWPTKYAAIFASCPLRLRSGLLLYGYPGCGKTLLASAVAKECGLNFISVKGPEILNKYIGASERSVRDLFDRAQAAKPCVLFFDEFDSIAPKRGHDSTGVTDRVVNQMLTQMDGAEALDGVYVLAATSRPDLIDSALLRPGRLDKSLLCDMPTLEDRVDIMKAIARKVHLHPEVDLEKWASRTEGFSGADLQALLYNAHLEAIHESINAATEEKEGEAKQDKDAAGAEGALKFTTIGGAKKTLSGAERQALVRKLELVLKNTQSQPLHKPSKTAGILPAHLSSGANGVSADHDADNDTPKKNKSKTLVTEAHLETSIKSTRPSVPLEEQRRLRGIYRTFAGDRDGNFPDGEASTQIGARSSLM